MFKPNDVVLCVDDRPDKYWGPHRYLKTGRTYTVKDVCVCCITRLMLTCYEHRGENPCIGCSAPVRGFRSNRFIKIAGNVTIAEERVEQPCLDSINQKPVRKKGFMEGLKRLKEKVFP
jgi:hypothetical protein